MSGVRIKHPTLANCTLLVKHPRTGLRKVEKEYHVRLDADGECIVSPTVWDQVTEAEQLTGVSTGLVVLNDVSKPPRLIIGNGVGGDVQRMFKAERDALREIAPHGTNPVVTRGRPPALTTKA